MSRNPFNSTKICYFALCFAFFILGTQINPCPRCPPRTKGEKDSLGKGDLALGIPAKDSESVAKVDNAEESSHYYNLDYWTWQKGLGEFGGRAEQWKFREFIKPTDTVVDFGCGGGFMLKNVNAAHKKGVEVNPHARQNAASLGIETVALPSELPDNFANVIISNHAIEHVPSPLMSLKSLLPKLKPGGYFVAVVPHDKAGSGFDPNDINRHIYTWNAQLFGNLFLEAGYQVVKAEDLQHMWPDNFEHVLEHDGEAVFIERGTAQAKAHNIVQIRVVARRPL